MSRDHAQLEHALARVLEPFPVAGPLPKWCAISDQAFRWDQQIFRQHWIPVGHESEVAAPGSFLVTDLCGERVVLVRGEDLALHAFLDGCLHRGTSMFEPGAGRLTELTFSCPYHGLRYDLRGRAEPATCPGVRLRPEPRLPPVEVVTRAGFVLVRLDVAGPLCEEPLVGMPPWLERASTFALRLGRRVSHSVAANWKLLVQNFQESHHFREVHPALEALTPAAKSGSEDLGGAFLTGTMELWPGADTVSSSGRLEGRPLVCGAGDERTVFDAHAFPGWLISLQPDYLLSYRLLPRSVRETVVDASIYFHSAAFKPSFDPSSIYTFWDRTNQEDREICERQQRGLDLGSSEVGAYALSEDGIHAFDRRVARAYLTLLEASR